MIPGVSDAAGLLIFFCGCFFAYLTLREESRAVRLPKTDRTRPFQCPICAYVYADEKQEDLSCCPRCATINRRQDACFR